VSTPAGASTPRARRAFDGVVAAIDVVSTVAGWFAGWLVVPRAVAVAYEVVARYAFNALCGL